MTKRECAGRWLYQTMLVLHRHNGTSNHLKRRPIIFTTCVPLAVASLEKALVVGGQDACEAAGAADIGLQQYVTMGGINQRPPVCLSRSSSALDVTLAAALPTTVRDALRFTIYNAVRSNALLRLDGVRF